MSYFYGGKNYKSFSEAMEAVMVDFPELGDDELIDFADAYIWEE